MTAVMFLTRIPTPRDISHSSEYLRQAPRYFPLVGWMVGILVSFAFLVFTWLTSVELGILASMVAGLLVTGAFHEDGLADVCDGMGGGWTREQVLTIMKDSRIGTYGVLGLISALGAKYLLLRQLTASTPEEMFGIPLATMNPMEILRRPLALVAGYRQLILMLVAAHGASRLMAVLVMQVSAYAGDPEKSKSIQLTGRQLSIGALAIAIVTGVAPFAFLPWPCALCLMPALAAAFLLQGYFNRRIGGYTGDCLGAIQQVSEIMIYLGFVITFRYL